jgi:hypothetical protein
MQSSREAGFFWKSVVVEVDGMTGMIGRAVFIFYFLVSPRYTKQSGWKLK